MEMMAYVSTYARYHQLRQRPLSSCGGVGHQRSCMSRETLCRLDGRYTSLIPSTASVATGLQHRQKHVLRQDEEERPIMQMPKPVSLTIFDAQPLSANSFVAGSTCKDGTEDQRKDNLSNHDSNHDLHEDSTHMPDNH